jgi:hypothetical protein
VLNIDVQNNQCSPPKSCIYSAINPLGPEIPNKYEVIVIDPPWNQGKTGKRKSRPRYYLYTCVN